MSSESRGVPERCVETSAAQNRTEQIGALGGCLLEGDAEQAQREKKVRRRALVTSTIVQAAVLLAVIAIPFFGRVQSIALANVMPIPPYHPYGGGERHHTVAPKPQVGPKPICFVCPAARPNKDSLEDGDKSSTNQVPESGDGIQEGQGLVCAGCIPIDKTEGPVPPQIPVTPVPSVVHVTHVDPAMLLERIEPIYPPLGKQMRRNGRVELRAMISADGTIESLEVVSGDPLFYQSALNAVRRWRYRATMLNGQAVKVDTYITVIYTMTQ